MTMFFKLSIPIIASLVGYFSCRRALVSENWLKHISQSISYILLPCMIVAAMANITISWSLIQLPIANVCVVLGLFILSLSYALIKKMPALEKGSFIAAFSSLEGGSIGLALVLLIYGARALPAFFVFDITHAVLVFTFTYFIACIYGTKHKISWKFVRSFFIGPIPLSVIIGLSLHFIFGGIHPAISNILNSIGYLILPAVMFVLGYRFVYFPHHLFSSVMTTLIKMLAGFLIAWGFVSFFHIGGYEKMVILLSASLPPSFLVIVFAEEQGLAKDFLVTFLPIAAIVSFFLLYFAYSTWGVITP